MFYAGLILALTRFRQREYAFVLLWLVTALAPALVTYPAPHFPRTLLAQWPVAALIAIALAVAAGLAGVAGGLIAPQLTPEAKQLFLALALVLQGPLQVLRRMLSMIGQLELRLLIVSFVSPCENEVDLASTI